MSRPAVIAAGCLLFTLSAAGRAQQTPPQQTPVFRAAVDLVHLDVSVLDANRRPVRGLTEKDFTVFEDARPQAITVFSAVDVPEVPPPPAPWVQTVPQEIQTNVGLQNTDGRLFVVLFDDAMIPNHPGFLATARGIAKRFVDRVTPNDRVAIVFSASGQSQNFTNDRAKLIKAIDTAKEGHARHTLGWESASDAKNGEWLIPGLVYIAGPVTDPDITYRAASVATLREVAETLINAPQRRKALIWISSGVEVDPGASAAPLNINKTGAVGARVSVNVRDANAKLNGQMPELFLRMQRANVTIYPVDPCGFGGFRAYVQTAAAALPQLNATSEMPPPEYDFLSAALYPEYRPRPQDVSNYMSTLSLQFLETAAKNTGGFAIINTNDFETGVNRIFEENSSYYLLGYAQPAGLLPGSLHRIRVEVNRPGVTVRTRNGYYIEEAPKRGRSKELAPLDKAIVGPVADGSFPMRAAIAAFAVPGRKDPVVTIALGLEQPGVSTRTSYDVQVQTNAYLTDGRPRLVGRRDTATVVLVPRKGVETARYDLLSQIALQPGRYELRLSAVRPTDNVRGSLYADVEVPDFAKEPLSASGLLVQVDPKGASAPASAFGDMLPVVPTSLREFRHSEQASVYFRIYQGGTASLDPAAVDARLVNSRDVQVGKGRDVIPVDQFHGGGRSADYTFSIPLASLPPDRYLLTFDVVMRDLKVTRAMQFTVIK